MAKKNFFRAFFIMSILFSFLMKVAFILFRKTYLNVELFEYEDAAQSMVKGEGFKNIFLGTTYYAPVHPFYPFVCSLVYRMNGSHLAVLVLQAAISTLLGLSVYWLGRRLFSPLVSWVACMLTLFHPALWVYTTLKLHSLVFDASWFVIILLSFMTLKESLSAARSFWTGVVSGLACLSRSTLGPFILFGTYWVMWQWRRKVPLRYLIVCTTLVLFAAFLVVVPWLIRNEKRLGHPIGIVSLFGLNLWLGNNPVASGSAYTPDGKRVLDFMPKEMSQRLGSLTEWEQNELFKEEALRFMKTHPRRTLILFWKKWFAFWWRFPQTGVQYPKMWSRIYTFYYLILLWVAMGGMMYTLFSKVHLRVDVVLILMLFFLVSMVQSLFFVEGRHRWAVEPVLLIFSAEGLRLVWSKTKALCAGFAVRSA